MPEHGFIQIMLKYKKWRIAAWAKIIVDTIYSDGISLQNFPVFYTGGLMAQNQRLSMAAAKSGIMHSKL
jgi:hypothetical protein